MIFNILLRLLQNLNACEKFKKEVYLQKFGGIAQRNFEISSPNYPYKKVMTMRILGRHIIAELYGVDKDLISKEEQVREIMDKVVKEAGIETVGGLYKQFNPHGVTGIVLISESHISIHTWPEYELVNLDIFTCGDSKQADRAFEAFLKYFKPKSYRHYILDRG